MKNKETSKSLYWSTILTLRGKGEACYLYCFIVTMIPEIISPIRCFFLETNINK